MSVFSEPAVLGATLAAAAFMVILIYVSVEDALKH